MPTHEFKVIGQPFYCLEEASSRRQNMNMQCGCARDLIGQLAGGFPGLDFLG